MGSLDWHGIVTLVVLIIVFIGLIREFVSPDITIFVGASFLVIVGIISPADFLSGFSQPVVFTLAMLYIVVKAMEVNGILNFIAQRILPSRGSYRYRLTFILLPVSVLSAFLHATPIVLMMTQTVRKWAFEQRLSPSKYLIPLSYAAMLGGMCTLIGASSNLVVSGLMQDANPASSLAFFDLTLVGLPCAVVGLFYIIFIGSRLLPERRSPEIAAAVGSQEFVAEFRVLEGAAVADRSVSDVRRYFGQDNLLEIRRNGDSIFSPGPDEIIHAGDRLVFATHISRLANLHAIRGLQTVEDKEFEFERISPHLAEVVVAVNSWLIGKTVRAAQFRRQYGASVAAVYRHGKRLLQPVGEILLRPGDTLLLLANRPWEMQPRYRNDLYTVTPAQELPVFTLKRALLVIGVLVAMVVITTAGVPIMLTSLGAAALLLITRSVTLRQASQSIDWHLLLLVASAFALSSAAYRTGVADLIARGVLYVVGTNPVLLIGGIFLITMLITEMVTHAAAAMLVFPIALEAATLAGYSGLSVLKTVGVTVAIAASSSFLTPIGYQTNMMVYAPGGYRFTDYARVGAILSLLQLIITTILVPLIWPLESH